MKNILKNCLLLLVPVLIYSCDKEENDNTASNPEINYKLKKLILPSTGVSRIDSEEYTYDTKGRISKISLGDGSFIYDVKYTEDLVTMDLVKHNYSGWVSVSEKIDIYMFDEKVQKIISERKHIRTTDNVVVKDSTTFSYSGNVLQQVDRFSKQNDDSFKLEKKMEFSFTDGNVTELKVNEFNNESIKKYTYDNNTYIEYGEQVYESPLFEISNKHYFFLIRDKVGLKSKNNLLSVVNHYNETGKPNVYFSELNFTHKLDSNGRLIEVSINGSGINSNDVVDINEKIEYKY